MSGTPSTGTRTVTIVGNFISTNGKILDAPEKLSTSLSPEMLGYIAKRSFFAEMGRVTKELAATEKLTITTNKLTFDSKNNLIDIEKTKRIADSNNLGGLSEIQLYTNALPIKHNVLEQIANKRLALEIQILTSRRT